jgi:cytochrome c oxidase subunit 2
MVSRIRPLERLPLAAGLLGLALASSACSPNDPGNALVPVGPAEAMEADLFNLIFWIAVAVFVIVEGLLIYTAFRYRRRTTEGAIPVQTHGNTRLEVTWTIIPTLILVFIAIPTLTTIASATSTPTGPGTLQVRVIGHQFWWEFDYPSLNVVTADEMHVPVGARVAVTVQSADVIHNFWIPRVGGKIQAIPNQINQTWVEADQTGVYFGQCFQLCGLSHANMRDRLVSQSQADFNAWVANQQKPAVAPTTAEEKAGQQVFLSSACVGCHTITGTTANGKIGPNLTHIGSHLSLAGATLENTSQNLAIWLHDPPAVKPGSIMPNLHLSDQQISQLVAYLESLK